MTTSYCPRCGAPKLPAAPVCHQCLQDDLQEAIAFLDKLQAALLDHHTGRFTLRPFAQTYDRDESLLFDCRQLLAEL